MIDRFWSVFIGTLECTNTVWKLGRCYLNFSCLDFLKGNCPYSFKGKILKKIVKTRNIQ